MDFQDEAARTGLQMKRKQKTLTLRPDDGIDVDRACARRDPANYETLITSDPIPLAQVKEEIKKIRKKYKHLTNEQAIMLLIYRASAQATMLCSGDSGGGRYARYCQQIGVKF
jgi:hypothetical protein